MKKASICIVTPALADANNGNWQTARRWADMLAGHYEVHLSKTWPQKNADSGRSFDVLIALHARRSADAVAAWALAHPDRMLVLVLTGTDLYRDIQTDPAAQRSLALATRVVVLQDQGPLALPPAWRHKARVVFQSSTTRQTLPKTARHLRALMVGHLRTEKMPQTFFEAAYLLRDEPGIRLDHIGEALDPALATAARQTARDCPQFRWLGGLPHADTRARIQRAHVLVHASRMEGGAHVVMEAVQSGTPVLASRIAGNVGMLGEAYGGYFPLGDAQALAERLRACRAEQQRGMAQSRDGLTQLQAQCETRRALFAPANEQAALLALLREPI